ncbi:MAG: hypothetical protein M3O01_09820 [Pseudomonadota bacterium]|nr:hypothetical protein [Pseudomonadota bacterium]
MIRKARVLAAGLALGAPVALAQHPANGRHPGTLCVATSDGAPSCGPAQVDWRADGTASVRVDDIVYHLKLHSSLVDVTVMHNVVQVDEFTAPFAWVGATLRFADAARQSRYEVTFGSAAQRGTLHQRSM